MDKKIAIIGAGPTGLAAAYRLKELGYKEWQIYERNDYVGGLAASFKDDKGFTWDIGGHILFSNYEYFNQLVEKLLNKDYLEHSRRAYIWACKRFVPYPFQNNIAYLPKKESWDCLKGLFLAKIKNVATAENFRDWILAEFGLGIAKYFMFPHNLKTWVYPLEGMSCAWIKERVSVVNLKRVLGNVILRRNDACWGPNSRFKFPLFGGTGEIFRRFIPHIKEHLFLNKEAIRIDVKNKEIIFSDGERKSYDILINTMPLDEFVKRAGLGQFFEITKELKYNSVFVVGLGIRKPSFSDKCWVYFPEDDCPFYRVTHFSNYSPYNIPAGDYSSLMCETAYSEYKFNPHNKNKIIEDTIRGLLNTKILSNEQRDSIVSTYLIDAQYAYPIPTLRRDEILQNIQEFLEKNNIYSRGRFGAWRYELGNMDHCVMQGIETVNKLMRDELI